jgi:hypothetical protein
MNWRRAIGLVTVALFALRALIPAGIMPDLDKLSEGTLELVICTGQGLETVTVDAASYGVPSSDHSTDQGSQFSDCAFGITVAKAFAAPALNDFVAAPLTAETTPWPVRDERTATASTTLPLGSRAPPHPLV